MDIDWWYNRMQSLTPEEKAVVMMAGPSTWSRDERTDAVYVKGDDYDKVTGNYAVALNIAAMSQAFKINVTCGPLRFFHNRRRALRRNRHR